MGRLGLAFLAGHCCIHVLAQLPETSYALVLVLAAALAIGLRSTATLVFILGLSWAWMHALERAEDGLDAKLEGHSIVVEGRISSLPEIEQQDVRFRFDTTASQDQVPRTLLLSWYRASQLPASGELWRLVVRLKQRNGFANPGGFDYEARLFADGVGAVGYVATDDRNGRLSKAHGYLILRARAWLAERMHSALPESSMLGILQGLAIGDTRMMSSEQWDVFAATGTTHLMAISGLHIAMVAALLAWLGGTILVHLPQAQRWGMGKLHGQVLAGGAAALMYCMLAGLSIPTQRTLAMLTLYFVARWLRRTLAVEHALGLALIALLIVDPFAPLSVGAWLSFGAVAVIVGAMSGRLVRDSAVINFVRVQLAVTFGLLPIIIVAFGSASLVSPLANVVSVPLFTLAIVPTVLVGTVGCAISPALGAPLLQLATAILQALWLPLQWLAEQPLALWHFPQPSVMTLLTLSCGASLLILPGFWPTRVLGVVLCLSPLSATQEGPAHGEFRLTVLDVGQGLSVVVQTQGHILVFDAGPAFRSGRDAAVLAVLPYLYSMGINRLDALIISHSDLDHRGGMSSLAKGLRTAQLLHGPSLTGSELAIANTAGCEAGQHWQWDAVQLEILHPAPGYSGSDNDTSCVLRVRGKSGSALIAGDIEANAESRLLSAGLDSVDVVVVPHHGSRTSSTPEFVAAVSPQVAVFSAGYRNRWGLPKADVVERWHQVGARILSTAQSGAIEIEVGESLRISEYRKRARRYWQRAPETD